MKIASALILSLAVPAVSLAGDPEFTLKTRAGGVRIVWGRTCSDPALVKIRIAGASGAGSVPLAWINKSASSNPKDPNSPMDFGIKLGNPIATYTVTISTTSSRYAIRLELIPLNEAHNSIQRAILTLEGNPGRSKPSLQVENGANIKMAKIVDGNTVQMLH